jgi:FtsH-binding integral membrane protein
VLLKTTDINEPVRKHLAKVYATLALTVIAAMGGAIAHVQFNIGGIITGLLTFVAMFFLATDRDKTNIPKRLGVVAACGFFKGASLGPLIQHAFHTDPSILVTAFLGTTCVFICFTLSALLARRRSMLFLGGTLSSMLFYMFLLSVVQLFVRSTLITNVNLYLGLFMFCGYILYDTQLIIEKSDRGSDDFVWDALELFIDFVAVFVRVLIILLQNTGDKDKKKKRGE